MDRWVGAAATAAGCLSKYWQNLSSDRDNISEISSGDSKYVNHEPSNGHPPRLARGKKRKEDVPTIERKNSDGNVLGRYPLDNALTIEATSSSERSLQNYNYSNEHYLSNPLPGVPNNENLNKYEGEYEISGDTCVHFSNHSIRENEGGSSHGSILNRGSVKSKHSYGCCVKPLNSIDSCLMTQVYQEHVRMEECVFSSRISPSSPTIRPFLVTKGNQVTVREDSNSVKIKLPKDVCSKRNEYVFGVPPLPTIESLELLKKRTSKTVKGHRRRIGRSREMGGDDQFPSQGSHETKILFFLGISIGMISSVIANKKEVEKMKDLLQQADNLVKDLQEEIEMKDSLTVKELANNSSCNSSFRYKAQNSLSPRENMASPTKYYSKESYDGNAKKNSESMSNIEAELEAELERLGLNINTSKLVETESDFVASHGELRADKINRQAVGQPELDLDRCKTLTPHPGSYAVSPRDLSLRLNEVIQSRLEERIIELETALQNTKKVLIMQSEHNKNSKPVLPLKSHISIRECSTVTQPLVMNLSGDSLDAYSEAYEELIKINESKEDSTLFDAHENNDQDGVQYDKSWRRNGFVNGSFSHHMLRSEEKKSEELFGGQLRTTQEWSPMVQELFDAYVSEDESNDFDYEMEKQLIKQIVEKSKKGSPAVLNAQKMLFSME